MTQEKEITLPIDDGTTRVLVLETSCGKARIIFRELEYNEMQNLSFLLEKRKNEATVEVQKELDALIFGAIDSVENLIAYGKEVTLDDIKAGTFPAKLRGAIEGGFYLTYASASSSEADEKKEEKEGASPQG